MKRILFVDDESRILDGLRRMLRGQRHDWEMSFAPGGEAAVAELEKSSFDVVVTDMRMPGMDGCELLSRVQRINPESLRIVLSGHTDPAMAADTARVAHQFHFKPTSPDALRQVVERGCELSATIPDGMRTMVGRITTFPVSEPSYRALLAALDQPDVSLEALTKIAERDIGIAGKLLQVVNSSFFGISPAVSEIGAAVRMLGAGTIRELVCGAGIFRPIRDLAGECFGLALQEEAVNAARAAAEAGDPAGRATRHARAILSEIGRLILWDAKPEEYSAIWHEAQLSGQPIEVLEEEFLGTTHSRLGSYLLGIWNLPTAIVDGIYAQDGVSGASAATLAAP